MLTSGFHAVPKGHVATIVTHLEMSAPPEGFAPIDLPQGAVLTLHERADLDWYRDLLFRVGAPWLWWTRQTLDDTALSAVIHDPLVELRSLDVEGRAEGVLEIDFRTPETCEVQFFGLTDRMIGSGAGRALMSFAIAHAFAKPVKRLYLHTCTLDSPQALGFYMRMGFVPTHQEVEIAPDPRLTGTLPRDLAPRIPMT